MKVLTLIFLLLIAQASYGASLTCNVVEGTGIGTTNNVNSAVYQLSALVRDGDTDPQITQKGKALTSMLISIFACANCAENGGHATPEIMVRLTNVKSGAVSGSVAFSDRVSGILQQGSEAISVDCNLN